MREGWEEKTLGEIGRIQTGSTPKTSEKDNFGRDIPFIKPADFLIDGSLDYENHGLSKKGLAKSRLVEEDSVLMVCIGATIGKVGFTEKDVTTNQQINSLTPSDGYSAKFIYYQMLTASFQQNVRDNAGQTTLPIINKKKWSNLRLHLPPLSEQKRIVAILDEAFAGTATAVANTEKNLANAHELFDSYLNNVFTRKGEGWAVAKICEIAKSSLIGLVRNKKEQGPGFPFRYLKMNNISNDNRLDDSKIVNVDANAEEIEKFSLRNGDFLFNTRNSHELVGKNCLFKSESTNATLFNNNIMRIRFKSELDAAFVSYAFSSKSIIEQLERIKSGTTNVAAIYYKTLQNVLVVFPPLPEQKRIAAILDRLAAETQRLEAIYQHKLANLAELKQSILHKAFSGEFTAQPERALQEAVA